MHKRIGLSSGLTLALSALAAATAFAAVVSGPLLLKDFRFHDLDKAIISAAGYDVGSVVYFRELASITPEQQQEIEKYDVAGCYPFYIMRLGKIDDIGYNCESFYCLGYVKGTRQCRDIAGQPYGGIAEIARRLTDPPVPPKPKFFTDFPAAQQTPAMKKRIDELKRYDCKPFYLPKFDIMVGEGYSCEEVGQYPFFSIKNSCVEDWRTTAGLVCDFPQRPDEFAIREKAIYWRGSGQAPDDSSSSASSALSSSSASSEPVVGFSDVISGQYGFTAIMDLARRGIISGYADGTFQPAKPVNRAEFTKLLAGALLERQPVADHNCFPDVGQEWFSPFVCTAKQLKWVNGYADGTFKPAQLISREEGIKIVVAALKLPLDADGVLPKGVAEAQWYTPYVRKAVAAKILLEGILQAGTPATRADAAVWIYRAHKLLMPVASSSESSTSSLGQ